MNQTSRRPLNNTNNIRNHIKHQLLQNIKQEFVRCFKRYRNLVNNNDSKIFRNDFYNTLKTEILKSLDYKEKQNIMQTIQQEFYSPEMTDMLSQSNHSEYFNNVSENSFMNSININSSWPNYILSTNDISDQSLGRNMDDEVIIDYFTSEGFTPRSTANGSNEFTSNNANKKPFVRYISIEQLSSSVENSGDEVKTSNYKDSIDEELILVQKLFSELTMAVEKEEDVVEKFNTLNAEHGNEMLKKIVSYVPHNQLQSSPKLEPIMFQMACKIDKYEGAFDRLHKDHLINLHQQNQYQMTVYNVLLIKDFELFQRFLSYLNTREFEIGISYFIQNIDGVDEMNMVVNSTDSHPRVFNYPIKTNKKDSIQHMEQYNSAEKILIHNGILYCRIVLNDPSKLKPLTVNEKQALVKNLDSLNILGFILNEPMENEESFTAELANIYPDSEPIIKLVVDKNPAALLESSFFILLAEKNVVNFFQCLKFLLSLKIERRFLCEMCLRENEEGRTLVSVVESKKNVNNAQTVNFILEFIEKYRN